MSREDFDHYLEDQIRLVTEKIADTRHAPGDPNDDVSRGKLLVYSALQKSVSKQNFPTRSWASWEPLMMCCRCWD